MPEVPIGNGPFFERGIDSITFKGRDSAQGMPRQYDLAPAELSKRPQLEVLLAAPNLDSILVDATRPLIPDRELLKPHKFRQALDGVRSLLAAKAKQMETSDPHTAKILVRAGRVLDEEVSLRDLLQMYRSVLYQG